MAYAAKVLADSVSPQGIRLLTVEVTFPRFILAEINTHRVFSRNSASSRAIPPERIIEKVRADPFVPETFNRRVLGMGVGEALEVDEHIQSRDLWLFASGQMIAVAERLIELGVDKSRINRLLEPFLWHTAIISSTEWENFFALRCPPGDEPTADFPAQLEFQKTTLCMREVMRASTPHPVPVGLWHLPLIDEEAEQNLDEEDLCLLSAGRCARVSFDKQGEYEPPDESIARARRLLDNGHLSPFEHQATPHVSFYTHCNFRGWLQYRNTIPYQENRVGFIERRAGWEG